MDINTTIKRQSFTYYSTHLKIVNTILDAGLMNKEISVMSAFMNLDKHLTEDDMFNTLARKKVKDQLGISSSSLSNQLKSLVDKGAITKHDITGKLTIKHFLFPSIDKQVYNLKLIITDEAK